MKPQINLLIKKATSSLSRKLFAAAIAATIFSASAFASGDEANSRAANSLKKEFENAKNVEWKVTPNYIKASFQWNDQNLEVFYNNTGETIAVSRFINESNLPLKAQQFITKKYADYKITEAIEYNSEEDGNCYYVSVTKNATKKILKISSEGEVSSYHP